MRSRERSGLLGRLTVGLCIVSSLACPGDHDGYSMQPATIPIGTQSASVALTVVVPEGDWKLGIEGAGRHEVSVRDAGPAIEEEDSDCVGQCSLPYFVLHCPRGKCSFVFDVSKHGDARLAAGIWLSGADDEGCGDPDPQYVPYEDRSRLFAITFDVRDVVLAPDAGVDGGRLDGGFRADAGLRADAGPGADASLRADVGFGVDAGFRLDAGR